MISTSSFQTGVPPLRVDVLTAIDGVEFGRAWRRRVRARFGDVAVSVIGRDDFLANKRATGRLKDMADAARLEGRETRARGATRRSRRRPRR